MHIGLIDTEWEGHHTPYAKNISDFFLGRGDRVTFFTAENHEHADELPDHDNFDIVYLPTTIVDGPPFVYNIIDQVQRTRQLRRFFEIVETIDVDLVHVLTMNSMHIPLFLTSIRQFTAVPIVGTVHRDHQFDTAVIDSRWKTVAADTYHSLARRALRRNVTSGLVDSVVVHSSRMADRMMNSGVSIDPSSIYSIPIPLPRVIHDTDKSGARRSLGLPDDHPLLLFFGGLRYEKGPDLLVEALEEIDDSYTLVFAGQAIDYSEDDIASWREVLDEHGTLIDRTYYIPEEEVLDYFVAADVLVLPYRRERGISGSIPIACATDTHVVGPSDSDVGAYIDDHGLGQTFDRGDASSLRNTIRSYFSNIDRYPTDQLREFDVTAGCVQLDELYTTLITTDTV